MTGQSDEERVCSDLVNCDIIVGMTDQTTHHHPPFLPVGKLPAALLADLLARYARPGPGVVVGPGIGRDATVLDWGDRYLVAKTDPITFATDTIGWYVVHVNANDMAAMGATPRWFLATVLLPEGRTTPAMAEEIFAQISRACREMEVSLCGGHTEITYGLDRPIVVGQMLGEVARDRLVTSAGAQVGDAILLTKGIAVEGTAIIAREKAAELIDDYPAEWITHCQNFLFNPGISVVRDAQVVTAVARVHAMHDPTEGGLATGLHELAQASGVGLLIRREAIPILPETAVLARRFGLDPLGLIASGSLLIALPLDDAPVAIKALREAGIQAGVIGQVWEPARGVKLESGGQIDDLPHFARDEIARLFE